MGYEDAEAIYEAMRSAAAAYGVLDVTISTSNELDDFIENLKTINETAYGEEDTIISVLTN
jgi:molecular chaperone GrpE (heat shock protein)